MFYFVRVSATISNDGIPSVRYHCIDGSQLFVVGPAKGKKPISLVIEKYTSRDKRLFRHVILPPIFVLGFSSPLNVHIGFSMGSNRMHACIVFFFIIVCLAIN